MDVSENDCKLESKAVDDDLLRKSVNDENSVAVEETLDGDENPEKLEEDGKVGLDPDGENEPSLDLTKSVESASSEEFTQAIENSVENNTTLESKIEQSLDGNGVDSVLNGIDSSLSGQNGGFSPTESDGKNDLSCDVIVSLSKGTEEIMLPDSDGSPEESSGAGAGAGAGAVDHLISNENVTTNVPKSEDVDADNSGGENSNMPQVPHIKERQAYVAVTPHPLQRTSWRGCCGLFELLKRSDQ